MLSAASMHLSSGGHADALTAHFEYPSRTTVGPAIIVIEDVKLSRQLSTLHMTLWQGELLPQEPWINISTSRRTVVSYTTHTNLRTFTGITLPTGWETTPAAELPPLPDFDKLKINGVGGSWERSRLPMNSELMRSLRNWDFYIPRDGPMTPGVLNMWIRMTRGEPITQSTLAYIVDSFPYNLHTFLVAPELRALLEVPQDRGSKTKNEKAEKPEEQDQRASLWFPTLVMNMEMKMALPEEGVEWLAVRVTSKLIKDGKFDLDVLVRSVDGEVIALSHHVAMILSIERNMREKEGKVKAAL